MAAKRSWRVCCDRAFNAIDNTHYPLGMSSLAPLYVGSTEAGHIRDNSWRYYYLNVPQIDAGVRFKLAPGGGPAASSDGTAVVDTSEGLVLYVRRSTPPNENLGSDSHYRLTAEYTITPCPADCSDNGECVRGRCYCNAGYTGEDCSMKEQTRYTALKFKEYTQGYVGASAWRYYYVNTDRKSAALVVELEVPPSAIGGELQMELEQRCLPDDEISGHNFSGLGLFLAENEKPTEDRHAIGDHKHFGGKSTVSTMCHPGFRGHDCLELDAPDPLPLLSERYHQLRFPPPEWRVLSIKVPMSPLVSLLAAEVHSLEATPGGGCTSLEELHVGVHVELVMECAPACSAFGACINGTCVCQEGHTGKDCGTLVLVAPPVAPQAAAQPWRWSWNALVREVVRVMKSELSHGGWLDFEQMVQDTMVIACLVVLAIVMALACWQLLCRKTGCETSVLGTGSMYLPLLSPTPGGAGLMRSASWKVLPSVIISPRPITISPGSKPGNNPQLDIRTSLELQHQNR
eukprot:gene5310-6454_t